MLVQNRNDGISLWGQESLGTEEAIFSQVLKIARRFQKVKTMRKIIPARGLQEAIKRKSSFQNSEYPSRLKCWVCDSELLNKM